MRTGPTRASMSWCGARGWRHRSLKGSVNWPRLPPRSALSSDCEGQEGRLMNFKDAKAVVTGAASGLGRATAARVIQFGGQVALLDLQEAAGQAAAAELGTRASFHRCDVTSEAEVDASMQAA